jgi:hypothetical protein
MDLNHTSKLLNSKRAEPCLDQVNHAAYVVHVYAGCQYPSKHETNGKQLALLILEFS